MKIHARHIAVMAFFATTLVSCQFDAKGIRGSGNVVTQERNISEPFTGVDASGGIEVAIPRVNNRYRFRPTTICRSTF